ncbi:MAG: putative LPS assembly protein LptD [Weeksellaceae bacterium]|nr:putative LPS assembly protein LptD [Weeksellaceae bacterium]
MHKKIFKYLFTLTFLLLINSWGLGQITEGNDSSLIIRDSLVIEPIKDERLEDVLIYNSDDQVHVWKNKMSYLLRNAVVKYTDMEIHADYVEINWETGDVFADGKRDSLGIITEPTIFKQAGKEYEQHSFKVNFKTKIGVAYNVRMEESGGVMVGGTVKRVNDSIMFVRHADYTTDTYFIDKKTDEPDYVLRTGRAKYIDGKNKSMITGPINMRIYDVPTPLTLPFSYIPLGDSRSAGIIIPSFGERNDVGFFLEGMGFYLPIGDYLDLSLTGEIYTKGSWGTHLNSSYRKRYKFRGGLRFDYENRITGIKGLDDYSRISNYRINWNHSQDPKANPHLIFSANVNMSSSQFFRESINNSNIFNGDVYTNSASSSISLNKTFPNSPFSLSVVASHHQNNNTSSNQPASMQFVLPQLTFSMSWIYPFAPKVGSKKGLLKNLAVGYNLNLVNNINTNEDDAFTPRMWENAKNGARHRVDFTTGATIGSYFPVSFNASFDEVWYLKTYEKSFDEEENQVITTDINGFDSYRTFSMGMGISTNIYGTLISKNENAYIKGIRHVISPSIGFNYRPNFGSEEWGYYDYYRGADGRKVLYSRFQDGVFGAPSIGESASISFGLRNNLEMKVRSKTDSTGFQKVKIFEYLDISSSYNMVAEEFKLSPINVSGMTRLFNQKLNLQFRASFDPYKIRFEDGVESGTRINQLGAFRLTDYSVNFGYNFDNKTFGEGFDAKKYDRRGEVRDENFYFDEYDYAHFSIPWRLGLNFTHTYSRGTLRKGVSTTVVAINASISPTPYWSLSTSTSYDFKAKKLSKARIMFNRDLRSFTLNFSWVPFGRHKTWDFFIGIKADILKDAVKYDERASTLLRGSDF